MSAYKFHYDKIKKMEDFFEWAKIELQKSISESDFKTIDVDLIDIWVSLQILKKDLEKIKVTYNCASCNFAEACSMYEGYKSEACLAYKEKTNGSKNRTAEG